MKAELIQHMGTDLTVVNAARVSFDKESEWETRGISYMDQRGYLSVKDQKLLSYLTKHNHWTPFSHVMITMRETVPIFVARQRFKHMVGFTYNEVSRRYVDDEPMFFEPTEWRKRAENKKQGSSHEVVEMGEWGDPTKNIYIEDCEIGEGRWHFNEIALKVYNGLLEKGVCPEQARMVLPQSMYTSYYTTGSLSAWSRAYKLRSDPHSQMEIQELAKQWYTIIEGIPELKYSWKALTEN